MNGGEIKNAETMSEPIAVFSWYPEIPTVGVDIQFNAFDSYDDETQHEDLLYRWDIEADGIWESEWWYSPYFFQNFSLAGPHLVKLEVKDEDGEVGHKIQTVYINATDIGGTSDHIKFFANRNPWNSTALFEMAQAYGAVGGEGQYQYEILTSPNMATVELVPGSDLVVIVNDQDQRFYDDLFKAKERLERFVQNGGTIFWGACDRGWGEGSMTEAGITELPGGIQFHDNYDHYNFNANSTHPIMQGLPNMMYGNYSSHEYFTNLTPGTVVYTVDSDDNPTLIEYPYGFGRIIVSGQPLSHGWKYSYDIGPILPRVIKYILGLDPQSHNGNSVPVGHDENTPDSAPPGPS
jgi:hypothetical protein